MNQKWLINGRLIEDPDDYLIGLINKEMMEEYCIMFDKLYKQDLISTDTDGVIIGKIFKEKYPEKDIDINGILFLSYAGCWRCIKKIGKSRQHSK